MAKSKPANHKSFRNKADSLFMEQFRGQPCEVCKAIEGTCGHHIVPKSRSKALRYDLKNILVLCFKHHTMGNDLAPHSTNQLAVERFLEWFKDTKPEQHEWITENERIERRYSYKQAVENLKAGRNAWE
jgi:hypothetical protein